MPDTRQIDAMLAKITEGAQTDEQRKAKLDAFAAKLNAVYQSPAAQVIPGALPLRIANPDAPLIPVARDPRAPAPGGMQPGAPPPLTTAPDAVTERVSQPAPDAVPEHPVEWTPQGGMAPSIPEQRPSPFQTFMGVRK